LLQVAVVEEALASSLRQRVPAEDVECMDDLLVGELSRHGVNERA